MNRHIRRIASVLSVAAVAAVLSACAYGEGYDNVSQYGYYEDGYGYNGNGGYGGFVVDGYGGYYGRNPYYDQYYGVPMTTFGVGGAPGYYDLGRNRSYGPGYYGPGYYGGYGGRPVRRGPRGGPAAPSGVQAGPPGF